MDRSVLGRTGLQVSRMVLGCGGHSRLGLSHGKSNAEAAEVVRAALDLGVNFFDTAESYRTETALGLGLRGVPRDSVVLSTKSGAADAEGLRSAASFRERVEGCLRRLGTDYVDVFNVHGVTPEEYDHTRDVLVPVLRRLQEEGKVRFLGVTEQFIVDTSHAMLQRALAEDDCWDVVMVGYSLVNFSAETTVLPLVREKHVGTQLMFAVRRALSQPGALSELMDRLVATGKTDPASFDLGDPLGFLIGPGGGDSLPDAAYRFARHESGMDVILSGTSSVEHLRANATSINAPPLAPEIVAQAREMFVGVDSESGN